MRSKLRGLRVESPITKELLANFAEQPVRQCDKDEWIIGSRRPFKEAVLGLGERLEDIVTHSGALVREEDGATLVIWGATFVRPGTTSVWLSASTEAEPMALALHVMLGAGFRELKANSEENLVAITLSYNELHHKWLRWLGFTNDGEEILAPARHLVFRYDNSTTESTNNV